MKHISLFSGIGGFDLAAQWAGWDNLASCEINHFGRRHLAYYWLNMHTDTVTRGLNTLMQQHVIHFEADFHSGTIHSIVINPKNLF